MNRLRTCLVYTLTGICAVLATSCSVGTTPQPTQQPRAPAQPAAQPAAAPAAQPAGQLGPAASATPQVAPAAGAAPLATEDTNITGVVAEATECARVVSSYGDAPLLIEGHTDNKGTHAYNIKLSQNRAEAVKKWLVDNAGIKPSRITTTGWGETKPVAPNRKPDGSDDPEGRQKNRRVEIVVKKG